MQRRDVALSPTRARQGSNAELLDSDRSQASVRSYLRSLLYFLGLGALGFGGPIATVGYMQRDLVEYRGWLERQDLLDGIALGQTMPGPAGGSSGDVGGPSPPGRRRRAGHGGRPIPGPSLPWVQCIFYGVSPG